MSPRYMLDMDSISYALRGEGNVAARILEHKPSELCMSAITLGELRYGAHRRASKKLHRLIDVFAASVAAHAFDFEAADEYGRLAAELADRGTPIGAFDVMIAAHALAKNVTLVTNNEKHFRKVSRLRIENWK